MIPIDQFVDAMSARLVSFDAKNVATPALQKAWSQIGDVLNEQIYGAPADTRWPVVPAELAVGKTLAIKVFASMMPRAGHPGVLVVVNRKDEADAMAATINEWGGAEVAKSYHKDVKDVSRSDLSPLARYAILVICHRRLEMGLDNGSDRFAALFNYDGRRRRAVLVDESLEMVYMADVRESEVRRLLAALPPQFSAPHSRAYDVLENFMRVMRRNPGPSRRLTADQLIESTGFTLAQAQRDIECLWWSISTNQRISANVKRDADGVLYAVLHQLDADEYRWQYTSRITKEASLHGHRLLSMPAGSRGVVMDATARLNYIYTSRPREFRIVDVERARDHSHVEILVGQGGEVGKNAVQTADKAAKHAKTILTGVLAALGAGAKDKHVLVATHKDGVAAFRNSPLATEFKSLDVCWWNAITGENAWGSCDVGVVATLPFLPLPADLSTAMAALEREMPDADLNGDLDELRRVRVMRMASEVSQFIGRLQRSTETRPTTVFMKVPDHRQQIEPDQLLALILETLRGAGAAIWEDGTTKTHRPGRGSAERDARGAAVATYLGAVAKDTREVSANTVRLAVKASTSSWGRFLQATTEVAGFKVVRPEVSGYGRETVFVRQ
jgi:hypothetical protein